MNQTPDHDSLDLLTPKQVASMLGMSTGALAAWRCYGGPGLAYVKVGRRVRYRRNVVEEYLRAHEKGGE